jgi:hypothetical protein
MKKSIYNILLFISFYSFIPIIYGQNYDSSHLPNDVKEKFHSLYPNITNQVDWKKRFNKYQADFLVNNKNLSILFNKHGDIINSKIEIDTTEVPTIVYDHIRTDYLNKFYKMIYLMKRSGKNETQFEVEVMKGRRKFVVIYNTNGKATNIYELDKRDILNMPTFSD